MAAAAIRWFANKPSCSSYILANFVSCSERHSFNTFSAASRRKEYTGKKLVGYSMEQMYDVVSDVEHYKRFVPFCNRSDVTEKTEAHQRANLEIGFPPIIECYTSLVTTVWPSIVKAECYDGKLFDHLTTAWKFEPGLKSIAQSCVINFFVSFEFKSVFHSQLANMFFNELVRQMERAFLTEAERRYGRPTIKTVDLKKL